MTRRQRNDFEILAEELERRFAEGVHAPWTDDAFDSLALEAFEYQFSANATYRAFCERRGVTPAAAEGWRDVPAVPATAFKHLDLVSVDGPASDGARAVGAVAKVWAASSGAGDVDVPARAVDSAAAIFRTSGTTARTGGTTARSSGTTARSSGTTAGLPLRGRHVVPRLSLYRASLLPPFKEHLLPEVDTIPFVSLVPPPHELNDSSLSYMVGAAAERFASEAHWVVSGTGELDEGRLRRALERLSDTGQPCLLVGTVLALWHLLGRLEASPAPLLPARSRVMQTGGFKGSGRAVSRAELHRKVSALLGVPADRVVSEYGMTELLSQLYTPVLREGARAAAEHVAPPWLRVRALDPVTLEELAPGTEGLLAFFDLANLGSVCPVLTEDVGSVREASSVVLSGRVRGAEPRGCSRAMDELMAAAGAGG